MERLAQDGARSQQRPYERRRRRQGRNGRESGTTVTLEGTRRQKSEQLELALDSRGEAPRSQHSGEVPTAGNGNERPGSDHRLMEAVVERANAMAALNACGRTGAVLASMG